MDSKPNIAFAAAPCLAVAAALFFLGTGLAPLWPLTWLAPVPESALDRFGVSLPGRRFFVAAACLRAWFPGMSGATLRVVLPTWIVSSFLGVSACLFAAGVLLFRTGVVRGKLWLAVLVFPAFWASVEFAIAMLSVHGTFFQHQLFANEFPPDFADCFGYGHLGHQFHDFSVCLRGCRAARPRSSLGEASAPDRQCRLDGGCVRLWCVAARVDAQFAGHEGCPDRLGRPGKSQPGHIGRSPTNLPALRGSHQTFSGSGGSVVRFA